MLINSLVHEIACVHCQMELSGAELSRLEVLLGTRITYGRGGDGAIPSATLSPLECWCTMIGCRMLGFHFSGFVGGGGGGGGGTIRQCF